VPRSSSTPPYASASTPVDPPAPHERAHARPQHVEVERLRQVVVGTRVEAAHHVGRLVLRGEHEHRRVASLAPQVLQDAHAVAVGQVDVEDDPVVLADERQRTTARMVGCVIHHVPLLAQRAADELREHAVVLDDEQLGHSSCRAVESWGGRGSARQGLAVRRHRARAVLQQDECSTVIYLTKIS
jgi:hypothetical protein